MSEGRLSKSAQGGSGTAREWLSYKRAGGSRKTRYASLKLRAGGSVWERFASFPGPDHLPELSRFPIDMHGRLGDCVVLAVDLAEPLPDRKSGAVSV